MAWLRLYTELLNDPKAQRLTGDEFKGWINILCLAKENDGAIPPLSDVAFALRMSEKQTEKLLLKLTKSGLIDETESGLEPHNWSVRQYKSDVSTERVKRFRKRSTKQEAAVSEAPPETETETEQKEVLSNAPRVDAPSPSKKKRRKGAREYDPDFLAWWERYPRREAKGDAFDAYWTMRGDGHGAEALQAGAVYAADKYAGTEEQFIPLPATFLRREQFLDAGSVTTGETGPPGDMTPEQKLDWWKQRFEEDARSNHQGQNQVCSGDAEPGRPAGNARTEPRNLEGLQPIKLPSFGVLHGGRGGG